MTSSVRVARLSAFVLVYTVGVILWGALVRITGSGAGCGQHWPTCHGEIVPPAPEIETIIEFTHRLTSGLCLLLIVAMFIAASRTFEGATGGGWWRNTWHGHPARRLAFLSVVFVIIESLLGAGLVLLEYVGDDDSYARGVWMAVHLANTFCLVCVIFFTAWYAARPQPVRWRGRPGVSPWLAAALVAIVLVSMLGAVAALGQTLFPAPPEMNVIEHVTRDVWAHTRYPMLVRGLHPVVSIAATFFVGWVALAAGDRIPTPRVKRAATWVIVALCAQVTIGVLNIGLGAPGWMQLVHLAMANLLWLALLWLVAEVGTSERAAT